jgi:putative tricarboxylic transport membrane protein
MRGADAAAALVWLGIGAGVGWAGWRLGLGAINDPGPGFVLFWVGLIMAGLALVVLGAALRAPAGASALWAGTRWPKVVLVLAALLVYAWGLPRLGFLLTTTLVLISLFKVVEPQRWWVALAGAVTSAVVGYVVFKIWLGAQLPAGLWEIG